MEYLRYQERLLILFSPTSLSTPVTLTVTDIEPPGIPASPGESGPASEDPLLQIEDLFFSSLKLDLKKHEKTDGSNVKPLLIINVKPLLIINVKPLLIASSDRFNVMQAFRS